MSEPKIVDATELIEFTEQGIRVEDFGKVKEWIEEKCKPEFAGKPQEYIFSGKSIYWNKKDVDDFINTLIKLEELYKKRNKS